MDRHERFTALFDAYGAHVHRYLRRRMSRASDVDYLMSEVFLIAWRRFAEIPREAELPWLYRTSWNVLANHSRKVVALPLGDATDLERIGQSGGDPADRVLEDAELAAAWRQLSDRDREVLRLSAWEGLTGAALGSALGVSTTAAATALSRARARFEEILAEPARSGRTVA